MKFAPLVLLLILGCKEVFYDLHKDSIIKNTQSLKSYAGLVEEQYDAAAKTEYEVFFQRPALYASRVLTPGPMKDSISVTDGSALYLYYPSTGFGIFIEGLPTIDDASLAGMIRETYDRYVREYDIDLRGVSTIAEYEVTRVMYRLKEKRPFAFNLDTWVYENLSFPLKTEIRDGKVQRYSYAFTKIEFNRPIPRERFALTPPAGATIGRWNLKANAVTLDGAKRTANFRFSLPARGLDGFTLATAVRQPGILPAFAFLHQKPPYYLLTFVIRDYGISLIPPYPGLRITGKKAMSLYFIGGVSMVYFVHQGVHYTMIGNLPYGDLLNAADSIE